MKKLKLIVGLILFSSLTHASAVEIPLKMNFQGIFSSGAVAVDFYITDSANSLNRQPIGQPWTENVSTTTANGMINHVLGSINSIPRSIFTESLTTRYLEVVIEGESSFMELVSVPFAYRASLANELAGGTTVQGLLNIFGNSKALHLKASNDQLLIEDSDGLEDEKKWMIKSDSGDFSLLSANDDFNQFSQAMRINRSGISVNSVSFPNGKLGVGTDSPDNELHLKTANINPRVSIESTSDSSTPEINLVSKNSDGLTKSANIFHSQGDRLGIWMTDIGEIFSIKQSGNIGIGNTNPAFKLDVTGIINAQDIYKNGSPFVGSTSQWGNVTGGITFSGGNVGIGTTDPKARLNIQGSEPSLPDFWVEGSSNALFTNSGNIGIGTSFPQGKLHMSGAGEQEFVLTRTDLINNPTFRFGRIIHAGDGDPEFRFVYNDDHTPERTIFEFDKKGIVASVKTGRGSHFEGFISGDSDPFFRLNSFPEMQLEMGAGGNTVTDVALRRGSDKSLGFILGDTSASSDEKMRIDSNGNVGIGTKTPQSTLQVNGYLQLALTDNVPPGIDCNEESETGRMIFSPTKNRLYVCSGISGWTYKKLTPAGN